MVSPQSCHRERPVPRVASPVVDRKHPVAQRSILLISFEVTRNKVYNSNAAKGPRPCPRDDYMSSRPCAVVEELPMARPSLGPDGKHAPTHFDGVFEVIAIAKSLGSTVRVVELQAPHPPPRDAQENVTDCSAKNEEA
eukprot:gene27010-9028_t